jgi:hypothetical protein
VSNQFNAVYPAFLEDLYQGNIDVTGVDLRLEAVSGAYVYDPADEDVADLTGRLETSPVLTGVAVSGRDLSVSSTTFAAVGPGDDLEAVVLFVDTGVDATSRLVAFIARRADTVPLVVETNGGPVTLTWPGPIVRI